MAFQSDELARREGDRLILRAEPLRLSWSFDDLVSSDGHAIRCLFTCSARALPEPAEQHMLREVFLASSLVLIPEAVVIHFQDAFRTAAAALCQGKTAAELLTSDGSNALAEALKLAGHRLAFSCGLELLPPFHATLSSPTLEQQRTEAMQRSLAEQRAAGQVEHFQRAAELLKQFQQIRASAPQLSPGDVLKQLSPTDQGTLLQTLLLASAKEKVTEAVWAVAGTSLVCINPTTRPPAKQALELPGDLGPLRSVQPAQGGPMLLVGARSGVLFLHPSSPTDAHRYADTQITSPLGFSRAVLWNEEIWACHGEAGIVAWKLSQPQQPALTLRPADLNGASPRNLQVLDDSRLVFSSKERLMVLTRTSGPEATQAVAHSIPTGSQAEIVALLPDRGRLIVVLADGTVQIRQDASLHLLHQEKRCGTVSAAALLPWLGSTRLLLASQDGPVLGVGLEDDLLSQYLNPYPGLFALAAAADLIVGLSSDRQRLLLWHSWNPRQLLADLFLPSLARHRAADVDVS